LTSESLAAGFRVYGARPAPGGPRPDGSGRSHCVRLSPERPRGSALSEGHAGTRLASRSCPGLFSARTSPGSDRGSPDDFPPALFSIQSSVPPDKLFVLPVVMSVPRAVGAEVQRIHRRSTHPLMGVANRSRRRRPERYPSAGSGRASRSAGCGPPLGHLSGVRRDGGRWPACLGRVSHEPSGRASPAKLAVARVELEVLESVIRPR